MGAIQGWVKTEWLIGWKSECTKSAFTLSPSPPIIRTQAVIVPLTHSPPGPVNSMPEGAWGPFYLLSLSLEARVTSDVASKVEFTLTMLT